MAKIHVNTTINGEPVEYLCETQQTMLDVLRDQLGLTGSKEGCGSGDCGACTVIVDGKSVNSCLMLAGQADGREITTIEGLARNGTLHPLQRAFHEEHALQCGYCTPGMIMAAVSLIDEHGTLDEAEIRKGLEGNLCRCTGYHNIVKAIQRAADELSPARA